MEKIRERPSQRDESMDRLLRTTFQKDRTGETSGACVGPEAIAAWTAGTLSAREAGAVEAHLAGCTSCQQVLALVARTEPSRVTSGFSWTRWHLRWAVPIAAAATAVAVWVAVPDRRKPQIEDAVSTAAPQRAATDQAQSAVPTPSTTTTELEKREAGPPPAAVTSLDEARSDTQARSATAASAREADAVGPAAPAAPEAAAPQQTRTFADAPADLQRQRREAFGPIEAASPDPLVRWRIVPPRTLERTTNGGQTWDAVALPQAIDLTAVRAPGPLTAIVTAADGRQFRTEDQGKTWNPVQP